MDKVKEPSVAGKFYTDDKKELLEQFAAFDVKNVYEYSSRAIIVPHAGYVYSGALAYKGFLQLNKNAKNIFIFAPSHYERIEGAGALSGYDRWKTPLGEISLNQDINRELEANFDCRFFDEAFSQEHSAEVQVPFIQHLFDDDVKIIPILTGYRGEDIEKIISHFWQDENNAFVISSDLSHFHSDDMAKKIDATTAQMVEMGEIENFTTDHACGGIGVCAITQFAKSKDYSMIRIGLTNSSTVNHNKKNVVGYGSWLLYEGRRSEFIKKYFSKTVLEAARRGIEKRDMTGVDVAPVLEQDGASFVTLELDNELRGCMGSIVPYRPLIEDILQNAYHSAFSDPRFPPLEKREEPFLSIAVSLLDIPVEIDFLQGDEEDLLSKITPYEDGIIIQDGAYKAVYLPGVWEQIPDKREFLNSLKHKAGLREDYFSKTFQAFRFGAQYVK